MLDGIDDVVWVSYHHAYGPAVDVPDDVRALRSRDPEVRADALGRLYGSVFHQGTRWRSSQHVVPFLVELASDPDTGHRSDIVGLLAHLAVGYPESWLARGFEEGGLVSGDASFEAGGNEYHVDQLDVYEAVCAEGERLVLLATDEDPTVRHAIAFTLALLPRIGGDSLPVLALLTESEVDPRLRANALVSVAILAQSMGRTSPVDFAAFLESHEPIVRYAAAIGLVRLPAGDLSAAVACLTGAIAEPPEPSLYWNEGDLAAFAALTLAVAPDPISGQAIEVLREQVKDAEGPAAERLIGPMLQMLFRDGPRSVPDRSSELSGPQRYSLEVLAKSTSVWNVAGMMYANVSQLFLRYGLPSTQDEMRAYLSA